MAADLPGPTYKARNFGEGGQGTGSYLKLEKEIIETAVVPFECLLHAKHYLKHLTYINLFTLVTTMRG